MALLKDIETKHGVTGNYLKLHDWRNGYVEVAVYVSKTARDNGRKPLQIMSYEVPADPDLMDDIKNKYYLKLKDLPEFSDATDDL